MPSRTAQIIATLVLLICLVCPLVEMFDTWDDTAQTGGNTEYALVLLALCVGVAYSLGLFVFKPDHWDFFGGRHFVQCIHCLSYSTPCGVNPPLFEEFGPPGRPLRI
jgi:hypothetical protein